LHGNTEGERRDIKKQHVLGLFTGLPGEDGGLDSGTVCDSLVRVNGLVQLAAAEEFADKRLDLGNTSGPADEDNIINLDQC
jgi:hypothetical protein